MVNQYYSRCARSLRLHKCIAAGDLDSTVLLARAQLPT